VFPEKRPMIVVSRTMIQMDGIPKRNTMLLLPKMEISFMD
jgi:hypothetical protein